MRVFYDLETGEVKAYSRTKQPVSPSQGEIDLAALGPDFDPNLHWINPETRMPFPKPPPPPPDPPQPSGLDTALAVLGTVRSLCSQIEMRSMTTPNDLKAGIVDLASATRQLAQATRAIADELSGAAAHARMEGSS